MLQQPPTIVELRTSSLSSPQRDGEEMRPAYQMPRTRSAAYLPLPTQLHLRHSPGVEHQGSLPAKRQLHRAISQQRQLPAIVLAQSDATTVVIDRGKGLPARLNVVDEYKRKPVALIWRELVQRDTEAAVVGSYLEAEVPFSAGEPPS